MAFSIGQEYDIGRITRESFRQEARNIGLGENVAMKRFDRLADTFSSALDKACEQLMQEGFVKAEDIKKRIVENRGGQYYAKDYFCNGSNCFRKNTFYQTEI